MKPGDLDDAAPPEPDAALLARVHARSASVRKRRRAQQLASVVSAVVVVALIGALALARVDTADGNHVATVVPSTTTTTRPGTATMLIGEWRPVTMAGYGGPLTSPPLRSAPQIRFTTEDKWEGSDGCNGQSGLYSLAANGVIHFHDTFSELVGCSQQTPQLAVLRAATRAEIHDGRLELFGPDRELAIYERFDVTARIVLPSTTMNAGSKMKAKVIVENDTGQALHVAGCLGIFAATLSNAHVNQGEPGWPACLQDIVIPTGSSNYPIAIEATYLECAQAPAPGVAPCVRDMPPPLPPGVYRVKLLQSTPIAPTPPALEVTVMPKS